jgi:hypothetical protein
VPEETYTNTVNKPTEKEIQEVGFNFARQHNNLKKMLQRDPHIEHIENKKPLSQLIQENTPETNYILKRLAHEEFKD